MSEGAMTQMNVTFRIWRQAGPNSAGSFVSYEVNGLTADMSLLEALDLLNERLTEKDAPAIDFDSDCREGICGSCSLMINGQPHGPDLGTASCQVYMRSFKDGDTIVIEPWRAKGFPVIKDLVVDRSSFDRIIAAGSYISAKSGPHPDGNSLPIPRDIADEALDAGACIQCGACVAACPNASAALFTGAQISRLAHLPQGQAESIRRVDRMVRQMDQEGFGQCTNIGECEAACPKKISINVIATMRREYWKALFSRRDA
jgi:succinate dehydrogenase / fumarate reductase iron-sulfur subunit